MSVLVGDCRVVMAGMDAESVDAVVTDPPYGLEFMGKEWDRLGDIGTISHSGPSERDGSSVFGRQRVAFSGSQNLRCRACGKWQWDYPDRKCTCERPDLPNWRAHQGTLMQAWHESWAVEALRVLKPGGHLLAFGGTRTYHRLVCAVEDAGFEIRDTIAWLYGEGFPKSLDVSHAINVAACPEPNGHAKPDATLRPDQHHCEVLPESGPWLGYGSALKPAMEPIVVARKPLVGTVAVNVGKHGVGGLNIDGCRIPSTVEDRDASNRAMSGQRAWRKAHQQGAASFPLGDAPMEMDPAGRWPANVVLDGEAAALLDQQTGQLASGSRAAGVRTGMGYHGADGDGGPAIVGDTGSASRFFYVAKAGTEERNAGLNGFPRRSAGTYEGNADHDGARKLGASPETTVAPTANGHPTVKPIDLMRWLCRLVTPPDGLILDPFTGSGTTGCAASLEGFRFIGIEQDPEYAQIADARIAHWAQYGHQPVLL